MFDPITAVGAYARPRRLSRGAMIGSLGAIALLIGSTANASPTASTYNPPFKGYSVFAGGVSTVGCGAGNFSKATYFSKLTGVGGFASKTHGSNCTGQPPILGYDAGTAGSDIEFHSPISLPNGSRTVIVNWSIAVNAWEVLNPAKCTRPVGQTDWSCDQNASNYIYVYVWVYDRATGQVTYPSANAWPAVHLNSFNNTVCVHRSCTFYSKGTPGTVYRYSVSQTVSTYINLTKANNHQYEVWFTFGNYAFVYFYAPGAPLKNASGSTFINEGTKGYGVHLNLIQVL